MFFAALGVLIKALEFLVPKYDVNNKFDLKIEKSLLNGERDEQGEIDLPREVEAYLPLCAPDPVLNSVRDHAVSWE